MNTTTKVQVQITYVNGMGDTVTTGACFDDMEALTLVLKTYGAEKIMGLEFTKPAFG